MTKLMITVVKDDMANEQQNTAGDQVEVLVKVPAYTTLTFVEGHRTTKINTRGEVYLVNSPRPRTRRSGPTGEIVKDILIYYKGYEGNDIYSAKELGIE